MSTHAMGTFEIESWEEEPYDEREGARLTRTRLTKTFHGDVEGESTAELLMAYAAEEGSAAYVGFERAVGRLVRGAGLRDRRAAGIAWGGPDHQRAGRRTLLHARLRLRVALLSGAASSESSEKLQPFLAVPILGAV